MVQFEEALLDIGYRNLESEYARYKDIDTKAIGIITICGILMAFITLPTNSEGIPSVLLLTALSFLITVWLSAKVIRVRGVKGLSTDCLIEDLKDLSPDLQIKGIANTIAKAELNIGKVCTIKAKELEHAVYALGTSIILLIIYTLSKSSIITLIFSLLSRGTSI